MVTKYIYPALSIILIFAFQSQVLPQNSNPNMKGGFYLGPMNYFFENTLQSLPHSQWYKDLHFNTMQSYNAHLDVSDDYYQSKGQKDGGFFEDINNYQSGITQTITNWNNIAHDNSLLFEREKILRPAYGQRFTYHAEGTGSWKDRFPSYGYGFSETGADYNEVWMNENVNGRQCIKGTHRPGFIVKDLYENLGQINDLRVVADNINSSGWERLFSDLKSPKYNMRWFVKPRMRINPAFAKANPEVPVVVVYVKNFKGEIIDSTIIACKNFLSKDAQENYSYDGRYLETFYGLNENALSVPTAKIADGVDNASNSKVDYMVKWLGNVDVWLDYVRVDDSWAHYLFTDTWEEGGQYPTGNIWQFRKRIKEEVDAFKNYDGMGYFWVDEVQYPNIECIGEVNRLVKKYSDNKLSLLYITDPIAFMGWAGLRNQDITRQDYWDFFIDTSITVGALSDIMVTQWFPIYYNKWYPDIFTSVSNLSFPATLKFKKALDYNKYTYDVDFGIQNWISWLIRQHKYYIAKAKSKELIYGVINQINSDEKGIKGTGKSDEWGVREPTNEELCMILNTSFVHGAKLLLEFSYSTTKQGKDGNGYRYNMGLVTEGPAYSDKRTYNYYGQLKWDCVAEYNLKLRQIAEIMYPMGKPNEHLIHDRTISVNNVTYPCPDCGISSYKYVSDVKSLAPLLSGVNPCMPGVNEYYDCPAQRFWELGFFSINPKSSNPNDKTKYLFALNKRTYPVSNINNNGDKRILKIKFTASELAGSDNWVLKDAVTGEVISSFNKNSNEYISAGVFNPGEGKLLKLVPAN